MILQRKRLSQSAAGKPSLLRSAFITSCSTLGRLLLKLLIRSGDPKITKIRRNGQLYWEVYDPHTEKTIPFSNEKDVYVWLDQQKYRQ